jgi:hypothetical protein
MTLILMPSAKMLHFHKLFHLLKHSSLLNLVNLKSSCNNIISTLIMVLCASYVCLLHCRILQISYTVEVWKIMELIYYYLYVN